MKMDTNKVICGDCRKVMENCPENSIDLVVTSPPYNVGKEYEEDRLSEEKYYNLMYTSLLEVKRVFKRDGRFCIVVPFRSGAKSGRWSRLEAVIKSVSESGMNMRDMIVWNQQDNFQGTAWGSWKSASAPNVQYQTEYILVGYNEQWNKVEKNGESTISGEEFKNWTKNNIWNIRPNSTKSDNPHPATFPKELVRRCIKLFSYRNDVVLDPFMGSGTSCVVAKELGREYIGIDKEKKYCEFAKKRLTQETIDMFLEEEK